MQKRLELGIYCLTFEKTDYFNSDIKAMRKLVIGDIHGGYKALIQCIERSGFDYENDLLIQLRDITDGYPDVYKCVEEFLKMKYLISIKVNHDDWFMNL